jgi:hypothetical protein
MDFAMSVQQSRRSRRGQSLQNHFATVLIDHGIAFTPQCLTELGERPDFVFPGCTEYHDDAFSAARLRMVACKSTAKERWRQILNEAAKIPDKYLLTIDSELTAPVVAAMAAARVQPFVPAPLLETVYATHPSRAGLASVGDLTDRLAGNYGTVERDG